jgi:hypothetical protein
VERLHEPVMIVAGSCEGRERSIRRTMKAAHVACVGALMAALLSGSSAPPAVARSADPNNASLSGLQWRFARVHYNAWPDLAARFVANYGVEPWAIDMPSAEDNLGRRLSTATAIEVGAPIVVNFDEPSLWDVPWLYLSEPGNLHLTDSDAATFREFLLRGGTATFDDFHGPIEWDNLARELQRVFPDRPIVDLPIEHPVFHSVYDMREYPQVAGLGSFLAGRSWEKGGFVARLRTILDDDGRAMVLINWNTDIGDGLEWSNATEYAGYLRYTQDAYRVMINEIVYSLTH